MSQIGQAHDKNIINNNCNNYGNNNNNKCMHIERSSNMEPSVKLPNQEYVAAFYSCFHLSVSFFLFFFNIFRLVW